ncbi:S24 family peptidase [Neisseria sp. S1]|uniref:S24 family peptidase n=1 Tax=Neisseria sp. S1 TaxID=3318354 RepID=UPI003A8B4EDF
MTTFKDRVMSLWPDLSVAKVSDLIGMSHMGLSKVFRTGGIPKADTLLSIHEKSGCDLKWLMTGEGTPFPDMPLNQQPMVVSQNKQTAEITDTLGNAVNTDEFVFIPRYDVFAAAGNGYPVENEKPLFHMAFRRYWIENYVTRDISKLSVIAVKGDSMEGVLNDGDNILVNHAATTPRDGLYVLRINNDLMVKRVQSVPGKLLVTSSNPAYAPFEIDLSDAGDNMAIVGRVEWFGRAVR